MRKLFWLGSIVAVFTACNSAADKAAEEQAVIEAEQKEMTDKLSKETTGRPQISENTNIHTIQYSDLPLANEPITVVNEGGSVIFMIRDVDARQLEISLTPQGKNDNLRINQVQYPSGKLDGPFGLSQIIPTPEKGRYQITIAPSTMASGKFPAGFEVSIR